MPFAIDNIARSLKLLQDSVNYRHFFLILKVLGPSATPSLYPIVHFQLYSLWNSKEWSQDHGGRADCTIYKPPSQVLPTRHIWQPSGCKTNCQIMSSAWDCRMWGRDWTCWTNHNPRMVYYTHTHTKSFLTFIVLNQNTKLELNISYLSLLDMLLIKQDRCQSDNIIFYLNC